MKKWFVFVMKQYYPRGGMQDFKGAFETCEEAEWFMETIIDDYAWGEVVDVTTYMEWE